jgi:hypothetical protein
MIVGFGAGSELVLYDDAVEQVWRFGRRRLQKDEIAYKMALTYKVPHVVLIPRDKKRKKMTITPCEYVRDDAFKAWMALFPTGWAADALVGLLSFDSARVGRARPPRTRRLKEVLFGLTAQKRDGMSPESRCEPPKRKVLRGLRNLRLPFVRCRHKTG